MFKGQNKSRKNDRFEFLQSLLNKYKSLDTSREEKHEILAHFANFAYDPTNREYFRRVFYNILNI